MTPKLPEQQRIKLIKRSLEKGESVTKLCKEAGISRVIFYRWVKRYKQEKKRLQETPLRKLSSNDRLAMINRIKAGEPVVKVCKHYGVSRTIVYRWLKRFEEAAEGFKHNALHDRKRQIERYYRQASVQDERAVLDAVCEYPELSTHKLVHVLPEVNGKPILGNHGVQNVLKRHDLSTYEKRAQYSLIHTKTNVSVQKAQVPDWSLPASPRYSFISFLSPPVLGRFFSTPKKAIITLASLALFVFINFFVLHTFFTTVGFAAKIGTFFAFTSLLFGMFFFFYSLKYYLTVAIVLSFSRKDQAEGKGSFFSRLFGFEISIEDAPRKENYSSLLRIPDGRGNQSAHGMQADLSGIRLERQPFISVHVSTFNEKRVIDRLLTAVTSFDYPNYEVIVADDSTDETVKLLENWRHHPRVKISHRDSRDGYKGQALQQALAMTDKRAEFIAVFDADFIPYADSLTQFLKYFQLTNGSLDFGQGERGEGKGERELNNSNIAAVQGYQWHVLNKSENWITRGVRSEYAGSYVIERSGAEIYHGLKQISGSVYMIRRDVLESIGWGRSITEDFQLTLKLYEQGFKVVYTPYIQAPAEAASTIKRLIRQRMRWAEGHSFNVKRMFTRLLIGRWEAVVIPSPSTSLRVDCVEGSHTNQAAQMNEIPPRAQPALSRFGLSSRSNDLSNGLGRNDKMQWVPSPLTLTEKLEFLYLTPYYLQAAFFIIGTLCWFLAEVVFHVRLPFWTEVWGWSMVLTNLFALPLMNMVGLFMEESDERDYMGLFSFIALSYIVAPFQAYAAVKGFLEKEEGPWFRTPKTGRITDTFAKNSFYRFVRGVFGKPALSQMKPAQSGFSLDINQYVALGTSNNRFNNFSIPKVKRLTWIPKVVLAILLCFTTTLVYFAKNVEVAYATDFSAANGLKLAVGTDGAGGTFPAWGNFLQSTGTYAASGGTRIMFKTNNANSSTNNYAWYTQMLPTGSGQASIPSGAYYLQIAASGGAPTRNIINVGIQLLLTNNNGIARTPLLASNFQINTSNANNTSVQYALGSLGSAQAITQANPNRLSLRILYINASNVSANVNWLLNNAVSPARLVIPANISVPEIPHMVIYAIVVAIIPLMPNLAEMLVEGRTRRRKRKHIFRELADSWVNLFKVILGKGEEYLDELPV